MVLTYDWYGVASGSEVLEQGDIVRGVPIIIPPQDLTALTHQEVEGTQISLDAELFDVIVMTQSCDIPKIKDTDELVLCPLQDYDELTQRESQFSGKYGWDNLRKGRFVSAHLLNRCEVEGHGFNYQVVDLRTVFSVPKGGIKSLIGDHERIRLLPPYREHLSQAFARQFMRVGLPIDLPPSRTN